VEPSTLECGERDEEKHHRMRRILDSSSARRRLHQLCPFRAQGARVGYGAQAEKADDSLEVGMGTANRQPSR
jgi:hypothetical protein